MIRHQVAQNSEEWLRARLSIPTASEFHRIVTPAGKPSKDKTARDYMNRLLAEWALGCPLEDEVETEWMARGHEFEGQAMRAYAFERDIDPISGGFWTTDDGMAGASPDFVVGDSGLLELKCPAPQTHIGYMLNGAIDDKYRVQVQGQLWVCEREWDDLQSYHPRFSTVIIRNERDEKYIDLLSKAVREFADRMLEAREKLEREYGPFRRIGEKPVETLKTDDVTTDADVDLIIRAGLCKPGTAELDSAQVR